MNLSLYHWIIVGSAGMALAVSVYILLASGANHSALHGCSGEESCNEVVSSAWGQLAGLPVAVYGVGWYVLLIALSLCSALPLEERGHRFISEGLVVMSLAGLGFIAWLTFLQWKVIHHFCVYCLSAHAFGLVAFLLVLGWPGQGTTGRRIRLRTGLPAGAMVLVMILTHILTVPQGVRAESLSSDLSASADGHADGPGSGSIAIGRAAPSRTVTFLDGNLQLDLYKVPLLGDAQSEHVLVELYDYNCPACRRVYHQVHEFREQHPGGVAVVCLPVPMEADCNPALKRTLAEFRHSCLYTSLAMAVYATDNAKFHQFHDWMMTGEHAPSPEAARARAEELIGKEALDQALAEKAGAAFAADGLNLYGFLQAETLPRIIAGDTIVSSAGRAPRKLHRRLAEALGIDAP